MSNIVSLYIDKYDIRDDESEEKRVRGIVNKIHEKGSVFCDFPFDYMMEDEQLVLLHHMMTSLPERQIMANMKKIDVDRYYRNLLGGLYRENPVKSRNYEAVKSSKKWENVGNSYIIPALLLYRYSYI